VTSTFISLRLPADLLEDAQRRAEIEDRSLSAVVRMSLRQYVGDDQHDQQRVTHDTQQAAA
jgi:predicted transcriptional regulator